MNIGIKKKPEKVVEGVLSDQSIMTEEQVAEYAEYIMNNPRQFEIFQETIRSSSVYGNKAGPRNDESIHPAGSGFTEI